MDEGHFPEFREGMRAFDQGRREFQNPYPYDSENWWRNEAWRKGYTQAEHDEANDDWDD